MSQDAKTGTIRDFRDIIAWQKSHELVIEIYNATAGFPAKEQFGLTNQIRRAVVSIISNIAEGFGRRTTADRLRFYDMARASLQEVQAQLLVARDVGFLSVNQHNGLEDKATQCHKLLTGLINKTKTLDSSLVTHNS